MKKILIFMLSLLVIGSMVFAGCGNAGGGKQTGGANAEVAEDANAEEMTQAADDASGNDEISGKVHIIEGWPEDVPAPDFGGEIESDLPDRSGINLVFRDVDPELVAQYVEKLRAAGFDVFADQHDKSMDGVYVDESGNPVIHHFFSAGKGEAVYNETLGGYIIDDGYYIEMVYSDVDEYNVDGGRLASTPKVRMYLMLKNIIVEGN